MPSPSTKSSFLRTAEMTTHPHTIPVTRPISSKHIQSQFCRCSLQKAYYTRVGQGGEALPVRYPSLIAY
eukprot:8195505-Pyramimonas_sp.AAC.1